jgi:hyperosmotically inducible protein
MRYIQRLLITALSIGGAACYGQTAPTQPDNTKVNARDRGAEAVTADQQKSNATDMKLSKTIRQSIIADKSLSTYAHNVKIISQNGVVTLKGPVKSETEKAAVIAKAVAATGDTSKVTDQISIKH